MIRETSLEAYRSLGDAGQLQEQESRLMRLVHRHYPLPVRFTRKELAATTGWTINVICGRVNSLVKKGYLAEYPETRDGGHLLSIAQPKTAVRSAQPCDQKPQASSSGGPSAAAAPCYDRNGKLLCYSIGRGPGWPPDQDHLHVKRRRAA